nr:hypothetical protein CFP56_04556 [Quercus suber]
MDETIVATLVTIKLDLDHSRLYPDSSGICCARITAGRCIRTKVDCAGRDRHLHSFLLWKRVCPEHEPAYCVSNRARRWQIDHVFDHDYMLSRNVSNPAGDLWSCSHDSLFTVYSLLLLPSSIVGIVLAIAGSIGPVLGGVITTYTGWYQSAHLFDRMNSNLTLFRRWIFWLNPLVAIPTMIVLFFARPKDTQNTRDAHLVSVTLSQVDTIAAVLLLILTTSFISSI